jgi:broad specificity phosphatase PhoE
LKVHWVRHGNVASHRGDVPVTEEGLARARARGRELAAELSPGEVVHFMHAPTRRARETAEAIRASMGEALDGEGAAELLQISEQRAIRNPDLYVAGQRVEMVSSAEALAAQLTTPHLAPEAVSVHPFFKEFWAAPDRIGYWVKHANPPGDDVETVARRQLAFASSLLDVPGEHPARYVLVTHSPVMRAVLRCCLGDDPGEPEFLESVDLTLSSGEKAVVGFRDRRETLCHS